MKLNGRNVNYIWYVNNSTREHFAEMILNRLKPVETRTHHAWKLMERAGITPGMSIGIAYDSMIHGVIDFQAVTDYQTEQVFNADFSRHHVQQGSRYAYDSRKGKVGLEVASPEWLDNPVQLEKSKGPRGFLKIS